MRFITGLLAFIGYFVGFLVFYDGLMIEPQSRMQVLIGVGIFFVSMLRFWTFWMAFIGGAVAGYHLTRK